MRRAACAGLVCALLVLAGCGKSDDALMREAAEQAAHQQWPDAMASYGAVLRAHPDGPRAAEALYKTAMIQYSQLKDVVGAATRFRDVALRFPSSPEAPKAMMILGFIYGEEPSIRDVDSARAWYGRLIAGYPSNDLVAGARVQLSHLGQPADSVVHAADGSAAHAGGMQFPADTLARSPGARALAH